METVNPILKRIITRAMWICSFKLIIFTPGYSFADQCTGYMDEQAQQRLNEMLSKAEEIIEYCHPCRDKKMIPKKLTDYKWVNKTLSLNSGGSVDLAYVYAKTSPDTYQNLALIAGCNTHDVPPVIKQKSGRFSLGWGTSQARNQRMASIKELALNVLDSAAQNTRSRRAFNVYSTFRQYLRNSVINVPAPGSDFPYCIQKGCGGYMQNNQIFLCRNTVEGIATFDSTPTGNASALEAIFHETAHATHLDEILDRRDIECGASLAQVSVMNDAGLTAWGSGYMRPGGAYGHVCTYIPSSAVIQ